MMKNDNLKKRVDNARSDFEVYETNYNSLWKGIEQELETPSTNTFVIWRVAAAILLLMVSVAVIFSINTESKSGVSLHQVSLELAETEQFYIQQISNKMQLIDSYPEVSTQARQELAALDSIYMELQVDLKDNIDNEEVVSAMIEHYRLKLDLLEGILNQIRKQGNGEEDEADEYFL